MGLSNVLFRGFHEVDFHLRIHPQGRDARTEKAAKAHVFRIRLLLKVCSMGIDPYDFYMHAKPDSNLRPWYGILFLQPRQATA